MAKTVITEAFKNWQLHCTEVQSATVVNRAESKQIQLDRVNRARKDYDYFVSYYFPHFAKCKNGKFQINAAKNILAKKNLKAVMKWARAHAKSTHMDIMIPLWLKCQKEREINVMVLVGKSQDNANTLLADIQAELQYNQRYINDFGKQYNAGSWTDGEFVTVDGVAFFARGRGQSPRGLRYRDNRPDYIVIDDLDDDELVENEARVSKMTDWVKEALFGSLDGGRGRFIMIGNLIGKNSVLARIAATDGVEVSQVNIYDKQGNITWKEKWNSEEVKAMEQFMGYRSFQKEYMNNPITEGAVFKNNWVKWEKPLPLSKYDAIVAYCDPSFKGTTRNDYKAIKVWGQKGTDLHNLFAFCRQCSITEMVRWFYDLHERMPDGACEYYIEANFLQDIILDEFTAEGNVRGYQLPIRADYRKKPDKYQRVEAISPLWERGFVSYNENMINDPDMKASLEQLLSFEKGSRTHDDAPDADEGAIYKLQKRTRQETFAPVIGRRESSRNSW
jgi:predicted phage terminase large subunit-like protein